MAEKTTIGFERICFFIALFIGGLAIFLHLFVFEHTADVSWLITLADRLADGSKLYVDIFEVNPPISVWLYMPWIWFENAIGGRAENWLTLATMCAFAFCVWLSRLVLRDSSPLHLPSMGLLLLVLAILFFVPTAIFAQREHLGMVFFIPFMALSAVRMEMRSHASVATWLKIACGICGALIAMIKPYYILAFIFVAVLQAIKAKSIKPFFYLENLVAALAVCVYAISVVVFYPQYFEFAQNVLLSVYSSPWSDKLFTLQRSISLLILLWIAPVILTWPNKPSAPAQGLIAISIGFAIACIWQGKGWDYHLFTAIVPAVLALVTTYTYQSAQNSLAMLKKVVALVALLPIALLSYNSIFQETFVRSAYAALDEIVPGQSIVIMTHDITRGNPSARYIDATWGGLYPSDWIASYGMRRLATDEISSERRAAIEDQIAQSVIRKREVLSTLPDIVITAPSEPEILQLFMADTQIAKIMQAYEPFLEFRGSVYHRRIK